MKDDLLARIEALEIDKPGIPQPFSGRLARENGWSRDFAERAVGEYKRFVYLAVRAGHPVTPSEVVDEVWHLHLCHTRSYWDELCAGILGRPLHHDPTEGGASEDRKFRNWYSRTLESYREVFNEDAPADIWPPVEERFAMTTEKAAPRSHRVAPKQTARRIAGLLVLAGLVPVLGGCGGMMAVTDGSSWLCPAFFVGLVVLLAFRGAKRGGRRGRKGGWGGGCGGGGNFGSGPDASGCGSSGCGGGGCGGGGD